MHHKNLPYAKTEQKILIVFTAGGITDFIQYYKSSHTIAFSLVGLLLLELGELDDVELFPFEKWLAISSNVLFFVSGQKKYRNIVKPTSNTMNTTKVYFPAAA
jgi:hypothetical protein